MHNPVKRWLLLSLLLLVAATPAFATFTQVQDVANTSCGSSVTTCAVTPSALGVGHMAVIMAAFAVNGITISSVSGGGGWNTITGTVNTSSSCNGSDTTSTVSISCAYILYINSAATTVTVTFSSSTTGAKIRLLEYSFTADGVALDTQSGKDQSSAVTNPTGTNVTTIGLFTGFTELGIAGISSAGTVSAIAGSFTSPADFSGGFGMAGYIGAANGTQQAWTTTSARAALSAVYFREMSAYSPVISTWDQEPYLVQGANSAVSDLFFNQPVKSGDVMVACWSSINQTSDPTFTDDLGSTWTVRSHQTVSSPELYCATATAGATGSNAVHVSAAGKTNNQLTLMEWGNVTETVDAQTASAFTWSSSATTMPNITTTYYRDLILNIIVSNSTSATSENTNATHQYQQITSTIQNHNQYVQYAVPFSDPGTVTGVSMNIATGNPAATKMVIALKSRAALTVCSNSIPDAIQGATYSFQLQACGGTGTNVWTTTAGSLPLGLSLASNGIISDTGAGCTNSNSNTITFQVTDAASSTATKSLTLTCASSANTIAIAHAASISTSFCLSDPNAATSIGFTPSAGNGLLIFLSGAGNVINFGRIRDNLGTVYTMIPNASVGSDVTQYYVGQYYYGVAPSSAALSISCDFATASAGATGGPNNNTGEVVELSNVQPVMDTYVASQLNSTAGGSPTTNSITLPVSGTVWSNASTATAAATLSADSPYTQNSNNTGGSRHWNSAYKIGAAAGSSSNTWTVGSNTSNVWGALNIFFRPTSSGLAPPVGGGRRKKGPF